VLADPADVDLAELWMVVERRVALEVRIDAAEDDPASRLLRFERWDAIRAVEGACLSRAYHATLRTNTQRTSVKSNR
jgi:hypothetical protein